MSQYRGGSSITRALSNPSTPLLPHGGRGMSLGVGTPMTLENRAAYPHDQRNVTYTDMGQPDQTLERKLDQMMEMITNTQQIVVEQQSSQVIIGEKMEQISADVLTLQKEVKDLHDQQNIIAQTNKRKAKIPKQLSLATKRVHQEADEENKFDSTEGYSADQNQRTRDFLSQQLKSKFGETYTQDMIHRAIYRYYESRRRLHNDSQPRRKQKVEENKKKQQTRAFQKRLYDRRVKFTKNEEEKKLMAQIDHQYMTEESESEGTIWRRELTWRSDDLTKFLHKLDKRSQKTALESGTGRFSLKTRVDASPSKIPLPKGAPHWACKAGATAEARDQQVCDQDLPVTGQPDQSQHCTPSGAGASTDSRRRISFNLETFEGFSSSESIDS